MADNFPAEQVRLVSQSHEFQQLLRENPALARRAARDRDRVVLDFMRAQNHSKGYKLAQYAKSVVDGFDPKKPPAIYVPPPPPPPTHPPVTHSLSCNTENGFKLHSPGTGPTFNFDPDTGDSIAFSFTGAGPLTVTLHDTTDTCTLYLGNAGTAALDPNVSQYTVIAPVSQPYAISAFNLTAIYGGTVVFVVRHEGTLPFAYATLQSLCSIIVHGV